MNGLTPPKCSPRRLCCELNSAQELLKEEFAAGLHALDRLRASDELLLSAGAGLPDAGRSVAREMRRKSCSWLGVKLFRRVWKWIWEETRGRGANAQGLRSIQYLSSSAERA